ncbi:MAG TPA: RDD family protein [Chryseosolibacter sp.]|nr:RDD family protein [Chryseosolibacter sp.]
MRQMTKPDKASFWKRLIACGIDGIVLALVNVLIIYMFRLDRATESVVVVLISYTYSIILEYYFQTTIGKSMLRLRIIRVDGRKPGFSNTFNRNIGKIVSVLPLYHGFTRILAPHERQTVHDELGGCLVIDVG